jgi:anti-sigma B factor antagonist
MCQHARNMQRVEISPTTRGWLVAGHVDAATCAAFEHGVGALPDVTGGPIELDMAGVAFIDSSGLGVCLTLAKRVTDAGGALVIRNPSAPVARLLRITSLGPLFGLSASELTPALD